MRPIIDMPLVLSNVPDPMQQYEKEGKWVYEQHPFWCTGYTYWDLHSEAPDLFLHLSKSDLVIFKVCSTFNRSYSRRY